MSAIPAKREYVEARIASSLDDADFIEQMKRIMAGQNVVLECSQQAAVDDTAEYMKEQKR